jgi:hypothetical protein
MDSCRKTNRKVLQQKNKRRKSNLASVPAFCNWTIAGRSHQIRTILAFPQTKCETWSGNLLPMMTMQHLNKHASTRRAESKQNTMVHVTRERFLHCRIYNANPPPPEALHSSKRSNATPVKTTGFHTNWVRYPGATFRVPHTTGEVPC